MRLSLIDGSIMAVFSAVLVDPFFPKLFIEYWTIWWTAWVIIVPLWYLILNMKKITSQEHIN
jgi:hypothetical protein